MILFFGLWKTFDHRQQNLPRVRCLDFSLSTHCYSLLPLQSELPLELEGPERHRDSTCCRLQLLTLVCRLHPGTFGPLLVKILHTGFLCPTFRECGGQSQNAQGLIAASLVQRIPNPYTIEQSYPSTQRQLHSRPACMRCTVIP